MSTKESSVDPSVTTRRTRSSAPKAGSVWESRIKHDQVKGGIKVFNATHQQNNNEDDKKVNKNDTLSLTPKQSPVGKRKTWKSEGNPIQIVKQGSLLSKNLDKQFEETRVSADEIKKIRSESFVDGIEKCPIGIKKSRSDEEFGVCEGKGITSDLENVGQIKIPFDDDENEEKMDKGIEVEIEKQSVGDVEKEISFDNKIVIEEKKLIQSNEKLPVAFSPIVKKQAIIHQIQTKPKPIPASGNFHGIPRTHSKLQSFVDLVMWRNVSKSAFIFGIGTIIIISSSFTKDLNISFISVISYLGIIYLAANFLIRSFINRGFSGMEQNYVVREDEALWVTKLVLPYMNEFLLKVRALFSGDPATTMKLAVLLFILARCGSSITIWKLAKLGFLGVFTVPKICSSYSSHLTSYGTFWIGRFRDAWESCSHKKVVGFAIFVLVWNMCSIVARIWAVFMFFVAFKYYQQRRSMIHEETTQQEATNEDPKTRQNIRSQRQERRTTTEIQKQKKPC